MPFNSSGVFANVAGASTAAAGQTVQSAVWDNIHIDYSNAFNMIMGQLINQNTFKNALCANGGFEVWQRGAGSAASLAISASTTVYTADRWYIATNANQASTVSAQTGLTNNSQLAGRVQRNAAQTGTGTITFGYPLDTDEVIRLRGLNLYVRAKVQSGANWSPSSIAIAFYTGTGSASKRGGGFTGETTIISTSVTLAAASAVTSISGASTVTVPTNATQGELQFTWVPSGTAGTSDYVDLDDVQLEAQITASTTWTQDAYQVLPFQVQLELCKRHYQKTFPYNIAPAQNATFQGALTIYTNAATRQGTAWEFKPELRIAPAVTFYCPNQASNNWIETTATGGTVTSIGSFADLNSNNSTQRTIIGATASGTSIAASNVLYIQADASAGL
jgi:hypothetical protein